MGGINPEKGPQPINNMLHHPLTTLTQQVNRNLFLSVASFYGAHAEIESAVLKEGEEEKIDEKGLEEIAKGFETTIIELTSAKDTIEKYRDNIKKDGTWHQPYFESLHYRITNMIGYAKKIKDTVNRKSFRHSAESGELQKSMWHNESNIGVRDASLFFIEEHGKAMNVHSEFVEITNTENTKFL